MPQKGSGAGLRGGAAGRLIVAALANPLPARRRE
jgi:hypothetical protein